MPVPYLSMLFTVPFPFCASKQHEYTSLNDQCLCQPKISRHSCAWRCSRNRTADISAEWNPGWNRLVCHESKRWSSSTSASSRIDRKVVRELAGLAFVERCENVILLGPRVEKTHGRCPGVKAADVGHRVLFMPQDRLVDADESEAGKPHGAPATTTELCAGLIPTK